MPAAHRVGEQLNLIRVGEPAARFHPTRSNKFNNIRIFAKIAACSFGKRLPAQRGGDPRARLQRVQPWALHEGHRLGDARDDQSAGRLLAALCHLSAATNLLVSPGSIFTSVGSNTILPRSEPLLSVLTSISAAAAKLATVSIAAAFRSSALCVVISCRLSSTDFDGIQDIKVTEEHGWRELTNASPSGINSRRALETFSGLLSFSASPPRRSGCS